MSKNCRLKFFYIFFFLSISYCRNIVTKNTIYKNNNVLVFGSGDDSDSFIKPKTKVVRETKLIEKCKPELLPQTIHTQHEKKKPYCFSYYPYENFFLAINQLHAKNIYNANQIILSDISRFDKAFKITVLDFGSILNSKIQNLEKTLEFDLNEKISSLRKYSFDKILINKNTLENSFTKDINDLMKKSNKSIIIYVANLADKEPNEIVSIVKENPDNNILIQNLVEIISKLSKDIFFLISSVSSIVSQNITQIFDSLNKNTKIEVDIIFEEYDKKLKRVILDESDIFDKKLKDLYAEIECNLLESVQSSFTEWAYQLNCFILENLA